MNLHWLPDTLLAIHLLAATAWVGGMLYALVVLRPALAVLDTPARMQMHMLTLKRFFPRGVARHAAHAADRAGAWCSPCGAAWRMCRSP